ncbi:MAG: SDR family NAD(P)-dependent oxidoreductase [Saprospiraceae bacterium]|nr:SDR family NAD(P)-dependent oxidoreductase [Candidatus Opimibacter skivensis]
MNKCVLITGATSGIGLATAREFAMHGYDLILTARREDRLAELKKELSSSFPVDITTLCFDIRNQAECASAISSIHRPIDILINNAGLARGLDFIHEGNLEHWEQMIDTNIKGLLYITRLVSPGMVERKSGHIINLCSTAGKEIYPKGNVYCATKFAVEALTRAIRADLYMHGIRVSQVAPGHVESTEFARVRFDWDEQKASIYEDFNPLTSKDVAEAIYFIASRPPHVNVQDILMMGTQQAGSTMVDRSGRKYDSTKE